MYWTDSASQCKTDAPDAFIHLNELFTVVKKKSENYPDYV